MRRYCLAGSMVVALLLVSSTARADMVENPQYASWAKHNAGTTVVHQMNTTAMGQSITMELTQRLIEVTDEQAVVEVSMKMNLMGQVQSPPPQQQTIPAQVERDQAEMTALPPGTEGTIKEIGSETIEAGGKSYECKIHEFSGQQGPQKVTGKVWTTKEIPGTLVKMEAHSEGAQGAADVNMTVMSVDAK